MAPCQPSESLPPSPSSPHPPPHPHTLPPHRFLQPGLLLKGVNLLYDDSNIPAGQPRKSWIMRSWQQREAVAEGLCEWQARRTPSPHPRWSDSWRRQTDVRLAADGRCSWSRASNSLHAPSAQANPYFAAGRVTVPALLDTFACQSFFNQASWAGGGARGGRRARGWCQAGLQPQWERGQRSASAVFLALILPLRAACPSPLLSAWRGPLNIRP